ncbi:hypothetical protein RJT34_24533 [Clitoria ternatea]|uniref:Myb/SANT-like DNA-binding domain-containing protein n=1 Tax=Clitoria ternatea TaxID=43366 RepID=A0AAN9FUB2_CLITE
MTSTYIESSILVVAVALQFYQKNLWVLSLTQNHGQFLSTPTKPVASNTNIHTLSYIPFFFTFSNNPILHPLSHFTFCSSLCSFNAVTLPHFVPSQLFITRVLVPDFCSPFLHCSTIRLTGSGMFPGLLGVENPLQQQQQKNLPSQQNPHNLHYPQMVAYATHHDTDTHTQPQQSMKPGYSSYSAKNKQPLSDEDGDDTSGDPKRKGGSPWQRMKWTDTMVRLLIMAVYYIGDEGGSEVNDPSGKKKQTGLMQKKGKWKSVSRAMMEKGFYVSPQQCEDKFNDLNKRYKRVNDILGKGTACRVVENQNLLDTMDLSPKMKKEVKKLLNSKHLFFREMCAYHNSCGHGNSNAPQQVEPGTEVSDPQPQAQTQQQQQQPQCFHSSGNGVGNLGGSGLRMLKIGRREEEEEEDDDDDDESEDYSSVDEDESGEGGSRGGQVGHGHEDEDENDGKPMKKKAKKVGGFSGTSNMMQQLSAEVSGVFQDGGRSAWEKKQWMRNRIMQLEEQHVSYQTQAFELEKQQLKWARYCGKKEREMERARLENQRKRLENERMVLLIRHKEVELPSRQQQQQQQHSST